MGNDCIIGNGYTNTKTVFKTDTGRHFELRIQAEGNGARVFYFFMIGKRIIVTNGFIKKTRATPQREIALALKYKKDYIRRNGYEK
jgi:phage-related protein